MLHGLSSFNYDFSEHSPWLFPGVQPELVTASIHNPVGFSRARWSASKKLLGPAVLRNPDFRIAFGQCRPRDSRPAETRTARNRVWVGGDRVRSFYRAQRSSLNRD